MSFEPRPERALDLGRQDTVHGVQSELADTLSEYALKHLKALIPLLWATNLVIEKEVHLSVDVHQGSTHKAAIVADAKLNWESRVVYEDGQLVIEGTLRVQSPNGLQFPFLDQELANIQEKS